VTVGKVKLTNFLAFHVPLPSDPNGSGGGGTARKLSKLPPPSTFPSTSNVPSPVICSRFGAGPKLTTTKWKPFCSSSPPAHALPASEGNEPSAMVPAPALFRNFLRFTSNSHLSFMFFLLATRR
jgi:hypothetical protein